MDDIYDVVVIGSGSAGMMAALRAHDLGMSVVVIEKAPKYGGTSATSGGVIWIPNNGLSGCGDSREEALRYLDAVTGEDVNRDRIEAYVDAGPDMIRYCQSIGMDFISIPWEDYYSEVPAARSDRSLALPIYDGRKLGDAFLLLREQFKRYKLFNRYSMDFNEAFTISARARGWRRALARVIGRYWLDVSTRSFTRRDRLLSLGASLIGPMLRNLLDRGVELRLDTRLEKLITTDQRVTGVQLSRFGRSYNVSARRGVIICAGGFEWNQELRNRFLSVPGSTQWSSSPANGNDGAALLAGLEIGASTEFTETQWMLPTMIMPIKGTSNFEETHQALFDVGRPHGFCVNRNGDRFVNEACGYDRFGNAMVEDQKKTGANAPCWHIFDSTFRAKFPAGGLMPKAIMPDWTIPADWWDHYFFKADSIAELARKIDLDPVKIEAVVTRMNDYARTGVDPEFGRGSTAYDRSFGDHTVKPNPNLGPIARAPYYAVPVLLGDIGSKGGLRADTFARVLDTQGQAIPGLYAAGNATGTPFGNCYPGAGGTIGPAMVFGFIAANHIAEAPADPRLGHNYQSTARSL